MFYYYSLGLLVCVWYEEVTGHHERVANYSAVVTRTEDSTPITEDQFELSQTTRHHHLGLVLEPGSSYRACVTNILFDIQECQVKFHILYSVQ